MNVLGVTAPIFLIIALGFAAVRLGWLTPGDTRALGAFVLRFAMPAQIYRALASRPLAEIADFRLLGAYGAASLLCFAAVFFAQGRGGRARAAMRALGGSSPNSGFVGFPIASLAVGPQATVALALCLIVENIVTIPLALTLAESAAGGVSKRALALRLMKNPLLIAIALGVAASLAGLALPAPLARAVDLMALAAPAAALFAIGGALVGLALDADLFSLAPVAAAKLIAHPALMWGLTALATGADPEVRRGMLIMASAPVFSIYPLICRPFGQEKPGAAILLIETALAFPTMSAWMLAF